MGRPKKQTSPRRTGNRRSHHLRELAKKVNAISPVKVSLGKRKKIV
jgi:ribosomal protein L32